MPFQSYAQNAEDVILWRVFRDQPTGFYIDVGASGPDESITTALYQKGWSGINLEPLPGYFAELEEKRPRDTNLQLAVSRKAGTAQLFHPTDSRFCAVSSLDTEQRDRLEQHGIATQAIDVLIVTLAEICEKHVRQPIDFLKIDVEGHEAGVIEGADWTRWRPRILVVEATEPMSPKPTHHEWEPHLLKAGYLFALFDGLNRFYVREEDRDLLPQLSLPANIFDNFIPAFLAERMRDLLDSESYHKSEVNRLQGELRQLQSHLQTVERSLQSTIREQHDALRTSQQEAQRALHQLVQTNQALAQVQVTSQHLAEELNHYMAPSGVVRWAKHRTKIALGHYRPRAAG